MSKIKKLKIENTIISITKVKEDDFICLTDMAKAKKGDNRAADIISNWISPSLRISKIKFCNMLLNRLLAHAIRTP